MFRIVGKKYKLKTYSTFYFKLDNTEKGDATFYMALVYTSIYRTFVIL